MFVVTTIFFIGFLKKKMDSFHGNNLIATQKLHMERNLIYYDIKKTLNLEQLVIKFESVTIKKEKIILYL